MLCGWELGKPALPEEDEARRIFGKAWNPRKLRNAF